MILEKPTIEYSFCYSIDFDHFSYVELFNENQISLQTLNRVRKTEAFQLIPGLLYWQNRLLCVELFSYCCRHDLLRLKSFSGHYRTLPRLFHCTLSSCCRVRRGNRIGFTLWSRLLATEKWVVGPKILLINAWT